MGIIPSGGRMKCWADLLSSLFLHFLYFVAPDDEFWASHMIVQDNPHSAKGPTNRANILPGLMEALASRQVEDTTGKPENVSVEERPNSAHDRLRIAISRSSEKVNIGKVEGVELQCNRSPRPEYASHLSEGRGKIHIRAGYAASDDVYRSVCEPRHVFGLARDEFCVWVANLRPFQRRPINVNAVVGNFPRSGDRCPNWIVSASHVENTNYHVLPSR
jgi:hypothetical protein